MEKNGKEPETFKHRSYFLIKVLLIVLCVVVVVQFALVAKGFASLKALSNRLNALEEEKTLPGFESPRSEARGTTRSKRSTEGTDLKKALLKLEER
jgi:cytoskeletal protein RodZ